jgi:hypothetical protein
VGQPHRCEARERVTAEGGEARDEVADDCLGFVPRSLSSEEP